MSTSQDQDNEFLKHKLHPNTYNDLKHHTNYLQVAYLSEHSLMGADKDSWFNTLGLLGSAIHSQLHKEEKEEKEPIHRIPRLDLQVHQHKSFIQKDHILYIPHHTIQGFYYINSGEDCLLTFASLTLVLGEKNYDPSSTKRRVPVLGQKYGSGKTALAQHFRDICRLYFHSLGEENFLYVLSFFRYVALQANTENEVKWELDGVHSWIHHILSTGSYKDKPESLKYYYNKAKRYFLPEHREQIIEMLSAEVYYLAFKKGQESGPMTKQCLELINKHSNVKLSKRPIYIFDEFLNGSENIVNDLDDFRWKITSSSAHVVLVGRGLNSLSNFSGQSGTGTKLLSITPQPFDLPHVGVLLNLTLATHGSSKEKDLSADDFVEWTQFIHRWTAGVPVILCEILQISTARRYMFEVFNGEKEEYSILTHTSNEVSRESTDKLTLLHGESYGRATVKFKSEEPFFPLFSSSLLLTLAGIPIHLETHVGNFIEPTNVLKDWLLNRGQLNNVRMSSLLSLLPSYTFSKDGRAHTVIPPLSPIELDSKNIYPFELLSRVQANEPKTSYGHIDGQCLENLSHYLFNSILCFHNDLSIFNFENNLIHSSFQKIPTPAKLFEWSASSNKITCFGEGLEGVQVSSDLCSIPRLSNPSKLLDGSNKGPLKNSQNFARCILNQLIELNKNWEGGVSNGLSYVPVPKSSSADGIILYWNMPKNDSTLRLIMISLQDKWGIQKSSISIENYKEEFLKTSMFESQLPWFLQKFNGLTDEFNAKKIHLIHFFFLIRPLTTIDNAGVFDVKSLLRNNGEDIGDDNEKEVNKNALKFWKNVKESKQEIVGNIRDMDSTFQESEGNEGVVEVDDVFFFIGNNQIHWLFGNGFQKVMEYIHNPNESDEDNANVQVKFGPSFTKELYKKLFAELLQRYTLEGSRPSYSHDVFKCISPTGSFNFPSLKRKRIM